MKTIYTTLSAQDLLGAIVDLGADPCLIEDTDTAQEVADHINAAQSKQEITYGDEFVTAAVKLGPTAKNNPRHIYSFVNGNQGLVCFGEDFKYSK